MCLCVANGDRRRLAVAQPATLAGLSCFPQRGSSGAYFDIPSINRFGEVLLS